MSANYMLQKSCKVFTFHISHFHSYSLPFQIPFKSLLHVGHILDSNASHNSFLHEYLWWHLTNLSVFVFAKIFAFLFSSSSSCSH